MHNAGCKIFNVLTQLEISLQEINFKIIFKCSIMYYGRIKILFLNIFIISHY